MKGEVFGKSISRQEFHMATDNLIRGQNKVGCMITSPLCPPPPPPPPQMKMDRNVSSTKVAVGHIAPGEPILTGVTMPACPA